MAGAAMSGPYRDAATGPTPLDEAIGNAVTAFLCGIVEAAEHQARRARRILSDSVIPRPDASELLRLLVLDDVERQTGVRAIAQSWKSPHDRTTKFIVTYKMRTIAERDVHDNDLMDVRDIRDVLVRVFEDLVAQSVNRLTVRGGYNGP